ncbi:DUF1800 domain-containing protein [uncultured Shewanella sp.]|uniref:DUF1800 domain-containing protein n=1 Tax=uncultured Shewanella sp. TaxID=173975 RepID=UPI00262A4A87|nr:DUF1800 domain-containing protein [uncultured Shewanella sp.]
MCAVFHIVLRKKVFCVFLFLSVCYVFSALAMDSETSPHIPPAIDFPVTSVAINSVSDADAARLLQQATFGSTLASIADVKELGIEAWIDQQINLPASFHAPLITQNYTHSSAIRLSAWWKTAIESEDQLRQRMAFALSQILVVSQNAAKLHERQEGLIHYYDLLVEHALGHYKALLYAVSLSPIMGKYLTHLGNAKATARTHPDENYARELLQLFSIGLHELHIDGSKKRDELGRLIPAYTQNDVENFAKVFTGWCFAQPTNDRFCNASNDYVTPMRAWNDYHDQTEKTLLLGQVLPPMQTAEMDLQGALNNLMAHSNMAPFISEQLIKRLTTSNPSPEYIARVAHVFNDNGQGIKGDLAAVAKAILLDDEARNGHVLFPDRFGKIKEPLLRMTQMWRALEAMTLHDNFRIYNLGVKTGQEPLNAPSVFNFYAPDFTTPILASLDLVSPELQISDESQLIEFYNYLFSPIRYGIAEETSAEEARYSWLYNQFTPLVALFESENGDDLVIERLNLLFIAGGMSMDLKTILKELISNIRAYDESRDAYNPYIIMANLVLVIMLSPEFVVQR